MTKPQMGHNQVNRRIYETNYAPESFQLKHTPYRYDQQLQALRVSVVGEFGEDARVLDLGCGPGAYLIPIVAKVRSAVGVDFSRRMLDECRRALGQRLPAHVSLVEADCTELPLADRSIDFAYSFSTLYYVKNLEEALAEVGRVLRPGGHAALELGNLYSLNTIVAEINHRRRGWAKPFHRSYASLRRALAEAGLIIRRRRSFQLLPMYGAPPELFFAWPLLASSWKRLASLRWRGRMVDEVVSGAPLLRHLAFRHLFLVTRPC